MISFIIPTKNEKSVLGKLLETLKTCSEPHEVIVTDGGSTDGTIEVAKSYTDKVLVYAGEGRQNIPQGKNDGAKLATGDFLIFLDADDIILDINNLLIKALKEFTDPRVLAILPKIKVVKENETWGDRAGYGILNTWNQLLNNFFHIGGAPGEFHMIRRGAFETLGGYNNSLPAAEDYEMYRRLNKIGRTKYVGSLTVYHTGRRVHQTGWPKLMATWMLNDISVMLFKKPVSAVWKEVR
jgi:glycosyltransferase involved in cell wall biosynthesis